jgi:hypothetical protein
MRRNLMTLVAATVLGGVMLTTVGAAHADDVVIDGTATTVVAPATTVTRNVTLVAVNDPGWNGDDGAAPLCNLRGGGHYVTASVTSSDPLVATVSPSTLTFNDCGESYPITVTALACGTATISVAVTDYKSAGGVNAVFNDDVLTITVSGTGCGGVKTCAKPAAPAWAAYFLQLNKVKAGTKTSTNLISNVAQHMGPGTMFDGVAKADQTAYADAVFAYLKTLNSSVTNRGTGRPGWSCS